MPTYRSDVLRVAAATLIAAATMTPGAPGFAAEEGWPCVQRKVPVISLGAVWAGPEIDADSRDWQSDSDVRELVNTLALRRTPIEEAEAKIADFGKAHEAEKGAKLSAVFTGLFQRASSERRQIIDGIERYQKRQEALADKIRANSHDLAVLLQKQDASEAEKTKSTELRNQLDWDTRIFEDREQSLTAVCEAPTLIEQRLFALSRAIQGAMS
jgi:hypothetical protein